MSRADAAQSPTEGAVAAAARAGDEAAFSTLFERYRGELRVHCYRMLASFDDAEDMVQETFLRAWRRRGSFEGRSSFRAWLYRIATNACLDALQRRPRATPSQAGGAEVTWLQPFPDHLLEGIAAGDDQPDEAVVEKETIELAFLVAIQHLPPRQRAVLILRDVLGWSAKETAALLDTTVASANSALQRARRSLEKHLSPRRSEWDAGTDATAEERALLQRFVDATEQGDGDAIARLLREDARFTMPPQLILVVGREAIVQAWEEGGFGSDWFGRLKCVLTRANRQPAVACYVQHPGETEWKALAVDVLRIEDGEVAEVTAFEAPVFPAFGLPPTLDPRSAA